jgi:phosphoglycerol transferase MdoB-like AlkP superfamily enzyme
MGAAVLLPRPNLTWEVKNMQNVREETVKQEARLPGKLQPAVRKIAGILWLWASFAGVELYLRLWIPCAQKYGLWVSMAWSCIFTAGVLLFPPRAGRIVYGLLYYPLSMFACAQIACDRILGHMIWLSDIAHAGEGAEYTGAILGSLPIRFWLGILLLIAVGRVGSRLMPSFRRRWQVRCLCILAAVAALHGSRAAMARCLYYDPDDVRQTADATVFRLTANNYGIYSTFYDAEKAYTVCGYYKLLEQDVLRHYIRPLLPSYQRELEAKKQTADAFFAARGAQEDNDMTGLLKGKNVVLVLMETMDDFLFNDEDTPTLCRLMSEGINFTNFYTPVYSSIHTFNTEFCVNTGFFLPTSGKSALYYSGNDFSESLPSAFRALGYRTNAFHYNSPVFYNRGVMLPAIGYDAYNSYEDYADSPDELYDECFPFKNDKLRELMLGGGEFFDYIITRNAHTPYTYDDDFAKTALEQYPEYVGKYGNETLDVIEAKARVVDDLFAQLLKQLEAYGELDNTVIIAFTDHYAYPIADQDMVMRLSGVDNTYLEMKTPCFIWASDLEPRTVDKTLNTADLAPTVLNLFGIHTGCDYLGQDAFDDRYPGYAVFSDGSWLSGDVLYSNGAVLEELHGGAADGVDLDAMNQTAQAFIRTSDALMETDYYAGS